MMKDPVQTYQINFNIPKHYVKHLTLMINCHRSNDIRIRIRFCLSLPYHKHNIVFNALMKLAVSAK